MGLIIWGLILAAMGTWLVLGSAGFRIDGQLALIAMAGGVGLILLIAAVISSFRRPKRWG